MQSSKLNFKKTFHFPLFTFHSRAGFTLIEILIAVAIIGVLSSLLMTNFIGIRQRARDAQRKADLRQIQSALELYRADIGSYPLTASFINCPTAAPVGLGNSDCSTTYMQKVPSDPQGSSYYNSGTYYYDSGGSTYTLGACLENFGEQGQNVQNTSPGGTGSCTSSRYYVLNNP